MVYDSIGFLNLNKSGIFFIGDNIFGVFFDWI